MKIPILLSLFCVLAMKGFTQKRIVDESIRYQQERMVYKQWSSSKFTPTSGFLGLNPYYWLTWGLMPGYKKKDLRPLSPTGPQTQRLALVSTMQQTTEQYSKEADSVRQVALMIIANHSGLASSADPLWHLYYSRMLKPVLDHSMDNIFLNVPSQARTQLISDGTYHWYTQELDLLNERIDGAKTSDMDRGNRILAYHQMLMDYRKLHQTWSSKVVEASKTQKRIAILEATKSIGLTPFSWSQDVDLEIVREIMKNRTY